MNNAIVTGSIAAVSKRENVSLAESFLSVDVMTIVDTSGSMHIKDAPGGRTRYQAACDELAAIQSSNPGKIGVIAFSSTAQFCPGGVPLDFGGSTNMAGALRFAKVADNLGIKLILISDGEPDNRKDTLDVARTFKSHIDTIYIGSERDGSGRRFLEELAAATGGRFEKSVAPAMLGEPVLKLLAMG